MTEFEYDCLQKKRTAYSARLRVGARRAVSLPSDSLNPAELQSRNGPCRVYRLGAPMDIEQFDAMPQDLQRARRESGPCWASAGSGCSRFWSGTRWPWISRTGRPGRRF